MQNQLFPKKLVQLVVFYSILFLPSPSSLIAQNQRFSAGLVAGLNFAELEGNDITAYYGINAGVVGMAKITKHTQLGVEVLFSQNGEYILPAFYPSIEYGTIRLKHLEMPLYLNRHIRSSKDKGYIDWQLQFGVAFIKLLDHYLENNQGVDITKEVVYDKKEAVVLQAGVHYFFTKQVGINLKASFPLTIDLDWTIAARIVYFI